MSFSDAIDVICVMLASAVFAKAIRRGREQYNEVVAARHEAREAPPVYVSVSGEEARGGAREVVVSRPVVAKRSRRVDVSPVRREDLDGCPPPPSPPFELTVGSTTAHVCETHAVQRASGNETPGHISHAEHKTCVAQVGRDFSISTHRDSTSTQDSPDDAVRALLSYLDGEDLIPRCRTDADYTPRGTRVRRKLSFGTESPISRNSAESAPHVISRRDSNDEAPAWRRAHAEVGFTPRGTRVRRKLSFGSESENATRSAPQAGLYTARARGGSKRKRVKRIMRRLRGMCCIGAKVSD